jgi:hypothetical protein
MKIKVSSRYGHMGIWAHDEGRWLQNLQIGGDVLTIESNSQHYDAMLCIWELTDEFLKFRGPKIFYCCEPSFYFRGWRRSKFELRKKLVSLRQDEFAWHHHQIHDMRVRHEIGQYRNLDTKLPDIRKKCAVSVLSNLGSPATRNIGRQFRLEFVLKAESDIYGAEREWEKFRLNNFSIPHCPRNYVGECPSGQKIHFLSQYHSCICLENANEPLYFTEKFLDAVRAGCVPIYRAHPTVREEYLKGAVWVDPADYDFDARETVNASLELDGQEVANNNFRWLEENQVFEKAGIVGIYNELVKILNSKLSGAINLPSKAERPNLEER